MAKNLRIVELADGGLDQAVMAQPAVDLPTKQLADLLYRSQYKSENQGIYVAPYESYHADSDTYDAQEPYDQYLEHMIADYLGEFATIREEAQRHFHREMSVGYYVELFIARLHRKFENHQDVGSLVMVDGYEKELTELK
ncbi:hypothetical protein MOO44_04350 [Nicoliella spurrieriana]|uniref:Uncharacterized protein n=1 Tax=Nicoliella spurrieriana TaxID=2925830 RepID=A0A976X5W3_9LACO|nr:hypothetical protein [Nicoliella spurrieriana]UQS87390.1 hypothetical protein MOO44_04350 [Nicoliella spurrieriana]